MWLPRECVLGNLWNGGVEFVKAYLLEYSSSNVGAEKIQKTKMKHNKLFFGW